MNKVSRILNQAIKSLTLIQETEDFKRGYWMCWLFITKNIQSKITQTEIRESENMFYKVRCLEEDLKLERARIASLRESMEKYKKFYKEYNTQLKKS